MKRFCIFLSSLFITMAAFSQSVKIGLLDINSVLASMPEIIDVQKEMTDLQNSYKAELTLISDEFQKLYEDYSNLDSATQELIKERRAKLVMDTQQKKEAFERQVLTNLEEKNKALMEPLYQKIQNALKQVAEENEVDIIMEMGGDNKVYYFNQKIVDVTPLVKEKLAASE